MTQKPQLAMAAAPAALLVAALSAGGCQAPRAADMAGRDVGRKAAPPCIRKVVCLFDQRPWLNADAAGDRDPEGISYRVFLDGGKGKGVLREGTFHVEMYQITRPAGESSKRTLVSDWHYPTSQFPTVAARILGAGYHLQLRWASKETAGGEIELITQFEDTSGSVVRSATKRFRVPKYVS